MNNGCCSLMSRSSWWNVITRLLCLNSGDDHDSDEGAELLAAAQEGLAADNVMSILSKNPTLIRLADPVGDNVLHMSARNGDIVTVRKLMAFLNKRRVSDLKEVLVDVNVNGETALHLALKNGRRELAYQLMKAEKEAPTIFNNDWMTPFELAWESGYSEVCQLMSDKYQQFRPCSASADVEMLAVMRDLMRPLLGNKDGNTALHRAAETGDLSKALCLIKGAPRTVYQVNRKGVSPLYLAVKAGHVDLVKDMVTQSRLRACASEILLHPKNATLAHLAIKTRSFGTLKALMEHLPELIKATNEKGWRPLSYAANKGYTDEVNYLLTNFPNSAKKCDKDGSFPIHKAVGGGHVSIIQAFFKHCPQTLQHVDKKGRSVLHIAVCYARADIFAYLTKEIKMDDSIMNLSDNYGKTFKDYTKELKH